jgi:hypothetical protein
MFEDSVTRRLPAEPVPASFPPIVAVIARSVRDEAIQLCGAAREAGLLRFARNDGALGDPFPREHRLGQ